jgi:integrase
MLPVSDINTGDTDMGDGLGKQAKVLTDAQVRAALSAIETRRYPARDRVMILLSVKAGLRAKEIALATCAIRKPEHGDRIIHSERDAGMSPGAVQVWFHRLYQEQLKWAGVSSHSGRRTFVTRCAKKIIEAGGSLRCVQELAGHASLSTTQRYIQGDTAAKRRVVDL